ncbi:hypothetical protein IJG04_00275 [Candidatus Saccharibacteria bacterium]|nr:hypothetical protein [Candidatus Saccharibacteria bacterium]
MSAEEVLRINEKNALDGNHDTFGNNKVVSHVLGKKLNTGKKKKVGIFSAGAFVTAMIIVFAVIFSGGNYAISAISEAIVNATNVQHTNSVYSKALVFQQALADGKVPSNTANLLKEKGAVVGYFDGDEFVESNTRDGGLVINYNGEIISGENNQFVDMVTTNAVFYEIFNESTYDMAGDYYDKAGQEVFRKLGTNRNNYTEDSDLEQVINSIMGEGSNVNINSVIRVEKTDENGNIYYDYESDGATVSSSSNSANELINGVLTKSASSSSVDSTLQTAEALNIADNMTRAQRGSLFYALIMENISKTKAGDGNESKINEVMNNVFYQSVEKNVVDEKTGEVLVVKGSMMESPSMYAVLSGERVNAGEVGNYSNDKVLRTVANRLGVVVDSDIMNNTLVSTSDSGKRSGMIGWYSNNGNVIGDSTNVEIISPTIDSSLVNNSFDTINGIPGGEFFVNSAVELEKKLAKQSGATSGDADAVREYAKVNAGILALEAEVDRNNRSPFDITSKNTFLGSIVYKMALLTKKSSNNWSGIMTIPKVVASAVGDLLPTTYADNESDSYLTSFGENCETLDNINAVGSAGCAEIATFDTSTLYDIFNDPGFIAFVEENTILGSDGVRTIKPNSDLAKFILYNDERETPVGMVDGGILDSITENTSSIPYMSDVVSMIKNFLGADEYSLKIASGEAFVNSSSNLDWQTYKYAQRYVSLARATEALRQNDGDSTAYTDLKFFEGDVTPVTAFLDNYRNIAER